jgi:hypothetical protein
MYCVKFGDRLREKFGFFTEGNEGGVHSNGTDFAGANQTDDESKDVSL